MNILVFTTNEWDDTNSIGNTMSNFFDSDIWKNDNFSNLYLRDGNPNNKVCNNYYQITMIELLKKMFFKEKIGRKFYYKNDEKNNFKKNTMETSEKRIINFIHKYSTNFVYSFMDFIFKRKKWINNRFKEYINETNPDILFVFFTNTSFLEPLVKYLKEKKNTKIVLFIADDVYGALDNNNFIYRNRKIKEMKSIMLNADKVYGISDEICNEYGSIFNKKIDILQKSCNFDFPVKDEINSTIKFVYAGNLLYGRDEILSKIAKAIDDNNKKNKQKAILEIYTGTSITKEFEEKLNIDGSSIIMGRRNYNEIIKIMHKADYNLHVESFQKKEIKKVRLSFSTKITDCMQSGSCIIGVGPENISSMKSIKKIPGSYTITSIDDIDKQIENIICDKDNIIKNANKIRDYAIKNYEITNNHKKMRNSFLNLMNKKG